MNFLSKSAIILGSVAFALGCLFFRYIPNKWYKPKSTYYSTLIEHNKNQENQIIRDNEDIDKLNKNVILLEDQIKFLRAQIKKIEQEPYYEIIRELPFRMDDERVQELIKAFEKIINELKNQLKDKDSLIIDKDSLIVRLQAIINDLKNQLANKDTLIERLQALINDLKNQLANKDALIKDKDIIIRTLNDKIDRLQALINDLKNQLANKDTLIKDKDTIIQTLKYEIDRLQAIINDLQNQLKDKKTQPILNDFKLLNPYLTYTVDGDTIREYKLFPEMEPKEKDHAGRVNYFHRQDFKVLCEKYQLDTFPIKWTTNKENLGNREYNQDGTMKEKHSWAVSKANFNIIFTNQPANPPYCMTQDCNKGEFTTPDALGKKAPHDFYNKSLCFYNSISDFDLINSCKLVYIFPITNLPYIRFITKNLECEFDWLRFILYSFEKHFSSNYQILKEFIKYVEETNYKGITKLAQNPVRNDLPANERLFTINKIPKQIIVKEGTPNQHTKTIDIIEIKYDLKTLVDKVNNLRLTTEKEKKNREFINQYAFLNDLT